MPAANEQDILAILSKIQAPNGNQDVVAAAMISAVHVRDGHVQFAVEVPAEKGAEMEPLRKTCEDAVRAIPGILSVTAVLTAEKPAAAPGSAPAPAPASASASALAQASGQTQAPASPSAKKPPLPPGARLPKLESRKKPKPVTQAPPVPIPGITSMIAVASGKGGVGKSTLTVNLALALAAKGMKIGVLDADIHGPSIPRMLGIQGHPESEDGKMLPMHNHGITTMSIGFLVDQDQPVIWRGPMVMSALEQMLRDVNWGELDLLLIDLPPGTGDVQLSLAQRAPLTGAVIVSTPQDVALGDARKGLNMFRKVDVPVLGVVENMSYFICTNCSERHYIFGNGGVRRMAKEMKTDFLGEIPLIQTIREHADKGTPIVAAEPQGAPAQAFAEVAEQLLEHLSATAAKAEKTSGWMSWLKKGK